MAASRDWMFCPQSGYLLQLDAQQGRAHCPMSGYSKRLADLAEVKVVTKTDMEDYRRRYHLEPLVKLEAEEGGTQGRQRAKIDQPCPKCDHPEMEYYTMQLRSADEGQTVFYECTNCGHKYNQNT